MLHNQPVLPKAPWEEEVDEMRAAYVAPIDAKDVDHAARSAFFAVSWLGRLIKGLLS